MPQGEEVASSRRADILVVSRDSDREAAERLVAGEDGKPARYQVVSIDSVNALERWPGARTIVLWHSGTDDSATAMHAVGERLHGGTKTVKYLVGPSASDAIEGGITDWSRFLPWAKPLIRNWSNGAFQAAVAEFSGRLLPEHDMAAESPTEPLSAFGEGLNAMVERYIERTAKGGSPDEPADPAEVAFFSSLDIVDVSAPEPEAEGLQPEHSVVFAAPQRDGWGNPVDWWEATHMPIPTVEMMPPALAPWVMDKARTTGWDAGMLLMDALGAAAGCAPDYLRLQPKVEEDTYLQSPRFWVLVVGESGSTGKSPALEEVMTPVWGKHSDMVRAAGVAEERYAMEQLIYDEQKRAYVSKAAKKDPALGDPPQKPAKPEAPRIVVSNATIEAVVDILEQQGGRGVLLLHDEVSSLFGGIGAYKQGLGSDRQDILQLNNGGKYALDRKGRKVLIDNWSASVIGGSQPSALAAITEKLSLADDGLLARFVPYLAHATVDELDTAIDKSARARYYRCISNLPDLAPGASPCRFDHGAQATYREAMAWVAAQTKSCANPGLCSHLAKYRAIMPRLCMVYQAIDSADLGRIEVLHEVSADTARRVWSLMLCLYEHAQQFYSVTLKDTRVKSGDIPWVAGLLLARGWLEFNIKMLSDAWSGYRDLSVPQRTNVLEHLELAGWISATGGMSRDQLRRTKFAVNPAVHDGRFHEQKIFYSARRAEHRAQAEAQRVAKRERMAGED